MGRQTDIMYRDTALPVNAEVVVLFDTTLAGNVVDPAATSEIDKFYADSAAERARRTHFAFPRAWPAISGLKRFLVRLTMSHDVTLDAYVSNDRGVTWARYDTEAVTASGADAESAHDYLLEGFKDWKLLLTSGGNQTTFVCSMSITDERGVAA